MTLRRRARDRHVLLVLVCARSHNTHSQRGVTDLPTKQQQLQQPMLMQPMQPLMQQPTLMQQQQQTQQQQQLQQQQQQQQQPMMSPRLMQQPMPVQLQPMQLQQALSQRQPAQQQSPQVNDAPLYLCVRHITIADVHPSAAREWRARVAAEHAEEIRRSAA
jgi:hypothetical protein